MADMKRIFDPELTRMSLRYAALAQEAYMRSLLQSIQAVSVKLSMTVPIDAEPVYPQIQTNPNATDRSSAYRIIEISLPLLTDEQRVSLFSSYCTSCECDDPRCQCDNDE